MERTDTKIKIKKVAKGLQKHNGNQAKVAKELGVTRGAVTNLIKRHPEEFIALMDKSGLSEKKLFMPIKDALEATKTANFEGEVLASDEPDHDTRLKASELAFRLRGRLSKDTGKEGDKHLHLHLEQAKTQEICDELAKQFYFLTGKPIDIEPLPDQEKAV